MFLFRSLGHLLLTALFVPFAFSQGASQTLTNCAQILNLTLEKAREEHPAAVRAVVTCYVPASQLCFVQDGTAGVYVYPSPWPKDLAPGSIVDVVGSTAAGRFSPILSRARITPTGQKTNIEPKRIAIEQLNSGRFDCQWVEIEGVVQNVVRGNDVWSLRVASGASSILALLYDLDPAITNWVDLRVRIRGVAGTYYSGDQLTGFGFFISGTRDVELLTPQVDPFTRPLRSMGKLAWYSPDGAMDHRVRIRGLVTVVWPAEAFFVEDQSGTIQVSPQTGQSSPNPGDVVELSGFIRNGTTPAPSIAGAVWKKTGSAEHPAPKIVGPSELLTKAPNGQLVSTEGTVISHRTFGELYLLLLEQGGRTIPVFSRTPPDVPMRGAKVKATGAWSACPLELAAQSGPGIWLGGTNDLVVLSPPPKPLASVTPSKTQAMVWAGAACLALGGLLAWRGYAAKRTATEQLQNTKREVIQLKEGRERLGRDLHDHIIQSIYAMGLNIEECRQLLNDPGKAEPRLRSALGEVNGVIRELRNVIQGLETNAIQPAEFRTALKSLALMLGDERSSRVRLDLDQDALDQLTPPQATELVHIAREAVSNSVRHGKALTNSFGLHVVSDRLQFSVEDDGCGFAVNTAETKGYGLRNMAKRAEALGAEFTIHSQEGSGTRIVLDIPKQKQHFSNSESRARIDR